MHNTKEANARFEIAWNETNIRWLLGEPTPNKELIAKLKRQIALLKEQLQGNSLDLERDGHGMFVA